MRNTVRIAVCSAALVALSGLAYAAPSLPVSIVNLPLSVTGTVSVGNTVPVTGTVNANITSGSVGIATTAANPLYVEGGDTARHAVEAACDVLFDSTGQAGCTLSTGGGAPLVPAGQILVIESISCRASVNHLSNPYSDLLLLISMPAAPNHANFYHNFLMSRFLSLTDGSPQLDYYAFATPMKMYAYGFPAATTNVFVQIQAGPFTAGVGGLTCSVSGYYVAQ